MKRIEKAVLLQIVKVVRGVKLVYCLKDSCGIYGIRISSTAKEESAILVNDVSRDLAEAERLVKLLADNLVPPCHVLEVLDNLSGG